MKGVFLHLSGASKILKEKAAIQGKEWEAKRMRFIEGKVCEWCGSGANLVVAVKIPLPPYLAQLKEASSKLLKARLEVGEFTEIVEKLLLCPKCGSASLSRRKQKKPAIKCRNCRAEFASPKEKTVRQGRIPPEQWKAFWEKYSPAIKGVVAAEREEAERSYRNLEQCIVLCKRCHFARQKGMTLCPSCGKNYRRAGNELCWECFKKTDRGREIARMYELVAYEHPWCKKKFGIERKFLGLLSDPTVCCQELCNDIASCEEYKERGAAGRDARQG